MSPFYTDLATLRTYMKDRIHDIAQHPTNYDIPDILVAVNTVAILVGMVGDGETETVISKLVDKPSFLMDGFR